MLFNTLSRPVKIGVIILLSGVGVLAIGTTMMSESFSYYGLLIIITGLFIYLAYSYSFMGRSRYQMDEGKKKRKK